MSRKLGLTILAAASLVLAAGCFLHYREGIHERSCTKELFAMDTYMTFTAFGKNSEKAVDAAMEEIQRLDGLLSTGEAGSEISKLNEAGEGTLSEDTSILLAAAREMYEKTGGLFDFTVYPLMSLWGFPTQEYHVPSGEELAEVLPLVDASRVEAKDGRVTLGEGQQIDFGGIAKGYASGKVMEIFRSFGVTSALVSLGGNVQALGGKPDGSPWNIGIRDPTGDPENVLAVVSVQDQAVITSGGYERYFEEDGNTYIHILDPRTGYPADSGLVSVTVVSGDGMRADALSTSLYLMGAEEAAAYWRASEDPFEMILVSEDGEILVTEGLQDSFRCGKEYSYIRKNDE